MDSNKPFSVPALLLLILSIVLTVGVKTFLRPCGMHDDGTYGSCHHAGQVILILGIIMVVQSLLLLFIKNRRAGLVISLTVLPVSIVTALIPGRIIRLCMMASMRCNAVMKPAVTILGVLIALLALVNALLQRRH